MLKEFRDFAMKGNIVDLAVAVILGGAFGSIVSSMVEDVITSEQLKKLQQITYALIEDSRRISQSNEVYDLDDGHNAQTPRLTRIKLPHKQNPYYWDILKQSGVTEVLRDVLGKDTTIITSKLNTKSPEEGVQLNGIKTGRFILTRMMICWHLG